MSRELDLTGLLHRWRTGDRAALDELIGALHEPLQRLAHARLRGERPDHTLDTGALVNEAYLELLDINRVAWQDRAHFLAVAAQVMRRVLVDYAVRRKAQKRGGAWLRVPLDENQMAADSTLETLLELDDVLRRLEADHPRQARAVELHYLGGLTQQEVAVAVGVSQPTVLRDLQFGRAWIARAWEGDLSRWRSPSTQRARP
jgi:RNA polymerase sigma factor (TIGR02999 family)